LKGASADDRQFGQVLLRRQHAAHALRQTLDGARRAVIGAHAKLVLALDLQEIGGPVEPRRDFGVLHRHRSRHLSKRIKQGGG
jgi:hypothetical protein